MKGAIIQTSGLTKRYGRFEAVRDLDLLVQPGRITAFLGPNGAGKSTTIRMLLGMMRPDSGSGTVLGLNIVDRRESVEMRRRIAYVAENKGLYDYMTVAQMIRFARGFYADWRIDAEQRLLGRYRLPPERKVKSLSKGMCTKLANLLAFARLPELLILDEPGDGLDPVGIEEMLETIVARAAEGCSVFFSSHQIAEVERIADDVCILSQGRLALATSLDELRESCRRIDMVFPKTMPQADIFRLRGVEGIRTEGCRISLIASENADEVVARARALEAADIAVTAVGLREIFLEKVRES